MRPRLTTPRVDWGFNLAYGITSAFLAAHWDSVIREFLYPLPVTQDAKEFIANEPSRTT